jgi:hypothetical protein
MNKFEYEKQKILTRINGLDTLGSEDIYAYKMTYMKDSLTEAKSEINIDKLTHEIIQEVKDVIKDYCCINFSDCEVEGFLKLHTKTTLTLIRFGVDTESSGRIYSDLFEWFLYEMPSPLNGHKLSEDESKKYYQLLKKVADLYGFNTVS